MYLPKVLSLASLIFLTSCSSEEKKLIKQQELSPSYYGYRIIDESEKEKDRMDELNRWYNWLIRHPTDEMSPIIDQIMGNVVPDKYGRY